MTGGSLHRRIAASADLSTRVPHRSWRGAILGGISLVLALAVGACGSDDSGVQIWCGGLCAAVARCGTAAADCVTRCVQAEPGLVHLSKGGASALRPCLQGLSCQAVSGNQTAWENEQEACWARARMSVAATDHARRLCSTLALALFDCGYAVAEEECGRLYSMWDDTVIDRVAACEAQPTCGDLDSCERSVYEAP